jgi:Iap family predicted aminopeptidase
MEKLVQDIGTRESGTDSERRAAEQIKAWFEEFGLANIRMEEFEVKTSQILKEEAVLSDGTQMKCLAVGNSLSTPPEGVEGEVVMLESTSPEALKNIKDKIAVLNLDLYQKDFLKIVKAGPLALIYPSSYMRQPPMYRSIWSEWTEKENIPAISMAHDDVLTVLKGSKRLKIITQVKKIVAKSQNVLGEVPGKLEDEDMLVCGHYDTVRALTGAHDNASGTAAVIELARIFAHEKLNRTLRFATFGSEELGLCGSYRYAENPENIKNLRFCLNLDGHGILLGNLNAHALGSNDLKSFLRFTANELEIPLTIRSDLGSSDHLSLAYYGVPSVQLIRIGGANPLMHINLKEELRWLDPAGFVTVGKLSQTLLERLIKARELPFEKEIPPDISKELEKRFENWGVKKKVK